MEPKDDHYTRDHYNQQLENYSKEFHLPELPESNRSQSKTNPSPIQDQPNRDEMIRAVKNGSDITNSQHTISPTENNDGPPLGFNYQMAQPKSNGLSSGNSASSPKITYIVQTPSPLQQVQWSCPAQTSSFAQPVGATSSPNPPQPPVPNTTFPAQYSNPIQPLVSNTTKSAAQNMSSNDPSPAALASTHQLQPINYPPPPPPPPPSTNMAPPPQAPCNTNNTLQVQINSSFARPSNDTHLQQAPQSNNGSQLAPNPYPPSAADQPVAMDNATESSSIASRFAAAAQGASMGNMRTTQYPLPYDAPSEFMTFPRPNSTDLTSQYCAYAQDAQMDAPGYHSAQVPILPQVAFAGGSLEKGLMPVPVYSSSTYHDLAMMAQRNNKNPARKKQPRQGSPAPKPRGRPKGSVGKKRNPPPQWEEVEYDMQEIAQHARKPYYVRRAEWQDLKLAGAVVPAGRAPTVNSMPGGDQMAFDGGQPAGWNNYPMPMMMMHNPSSYDNHQVQNGGLHAGIPNPSDHSPVAVVGANPNPYHVNHQSSATQYGNAASEAVHSVPPRQASTDMTLIHAAPPVENPSKFWSFGNNNPPGTMPFPSQNSANKNNGSLIIINPGSAESKGKQAIENPKISSAPSGVQVVVQAAPSRNNSCTEFGTAGSSNIEHQSQGTNNNYSTTSVTVEPIRGSFSNSGSHESTMEPAVAVAADNNNQNWGGGHQSTYIYFENGCLGVAEKGGQGPASSNGPKTSASAAPSSGNIKNPTFNSYEDAVATQVVAQSNNTAVGSTSVMESSNNNTSMPKLMHPANDQVVLDDHDPISVSDYFSDYEGMQLTDEDFFTCALREQIIPQPNAQPIQQQQQLQVAPQPTDLNSQAHHTMPSEVVEQQGIIAQQTSQAAARAPIPQPMQSGAAGQQMSTSGVDQTYNSSGQLGQQSANNINGDNNQPSNVLPPPQPFQQNPSAQYQPVQDGSNSGQQAYMQQNNTSYVANNPSSAHQGSASQLPTARQTIRPRNIPRISGPPDLFFNQQHQQPMQQQQANSSVNGPRSYAMLPPPVQQHQASGFMINRPFMEQQYYQYGGTGNVRPPLPPKTTRRRRQIIQPANCPVIDFNRCAITPTMFNDMAHDGSMDSVFGSDVWAGLNQDLYNIMVMTDPSLVLNTERLQERIAQINSGMLPVPNLLNAVRNAQQAAGFSAAPAPAANRMMGNSNTMNYAPPNGMQPYPTTQQGPGLAVGAYNYNIANPNARAPQMLMNLQGGGQMNANMQQGHPNFGYLHEYPAPPPSSQRPEEMQQPVLVNQPSAQENVNYNPPPQHAALPNTQQAPNQAYNNAMFGSYAPGGPHM